MSINRMDWELLTQLERMGGVGLGDLLRQNYQNAFEALSRVDQLVANREIRLEDPSKSFAGLVEAAVTTAADGTDPEEDGARFIKSRYKDLNKVFLSLSDRGLKKYQS